MKNFVLMEPFSFQHFIMSDLIRVVIAQKWENVVFFGVRMRKAVFIFPFVWVHSKDELLPVQSLCIFYGVHAIDFLLVQEIVE